MSSWTLKRLITPVNLLSDDWFYIHSNEITKAPIKSLWFYMASDILVNKCQHHAIIITNDDIVLIDWTIGNTHLLLWVTFSGCRIFCSYGSPIKGFIYSTLGTI